jgi:hypothetical protein
LEALDFGKPKCVIRLMRSANGDVNFLVHVESHDEEDGQFGKNQKFGAEICSHDAFTTSKQIDVFMKTCVLPLAMQTHALIICSGSNDCSLAASLQRIIVPEQSIC